VSRQRNRSMGNLTDSASGLQTLLQHVVDKPVPLARLACLLLAMGHGQRARELCARATALAPDNAEVQAISAGILSHNVGSWYFPMVRDRVRNAAMETALRRAIRPGCRVLEIGTGTALFAMMAARAGAAEVITCESDPVVAAAATEIIARNGFAGRVRVIAKSSAELELGVDFREPADVLIWDTFGSNMIGVGALSVIEHATRRLMRPGTPTIPARGTVRIALAEDRKLHLREMHIVEGFDLSPFNRLTAPSYPMQIGDERLMLCGEPADLFHFDFQSGGPFPESQASITLPSSGGLVNGIAQWQRLELDDNVWYENVPSAGASSVFNLVFYPLRKPIELEPGAKLLVCGTHDRRSFRIWVDGQQEG
jgi:type III protein arginine methyltransferase